MNDPLVATGLSLLSPSNQVIGRIVLSITSTGPSINTVATEGAGHVDLLATPSIAEPVQTLAQTITTTPVIMPVAAIPDVAKRLLDRIETILRSGDTITQVRHSSTCCRIHRPYLSRPLRSILMAA